ncbi:MAG: hypothetical protein ACRCUJ_13410 [Phocaeicola sp.]
MIRRLTIWHGLLLWMLLCVVSGCRNVEHTPVVSRVIDATSYDKELAYLLEYDSQGRMSRYGAMNFTYGNNQININRTVDSENHSYRNYSITLMLSKGRVKESFSSYTMQVDDENTMQVVDKQTNYDCVADTLFISSTYRLTSTNRLVKAVRRKCVLDSQQRIVEMISSSDGMNDTIVSCHTFYGYQDNIQYKANLNLSAYSMGVKEPDEFFFFLLNIGDVVNSTNLPNDLSYNVNRGEKLYRVAENYHFAEDNIIRLELLKNEQQLLARYAFEYLP